MTVDCPTHRDATELASALRELARDAHALLNDPASDPSSFALLHHRLNHLERSLGHTPRNAHVRRWIANLRNDLRKTNPARTNRELAAY